MSVPYPRARFIADGHRYAAQTVQEKLDEALSRLPSATALRDDASAQRRELLPKLRWQIAVEAVTSGAALCSLGATPLRLLRRALAHARAAAAAEAAQAEKAETEARARAVWAEGGRALERALRRAGAEEDLIDTACGGAAAQAASEAAVVACLSAGVRQRAEALSADLDRARALPGWRDPRVHLQRTHARSLLPALRDAAGKLSARAAQTEADLRGLAEYVSLLRRAADAGAASADAATVEQSGFQGLNDILVSVGAFRLFFLL